MKTENKCVCGCGCIASNYSATSGYCTACRDNGCVGATYPCISCKMPTNSESGYCKSCEPMDPDIEKAARKSLTEEAFKRCQKEGFGWLADVEWSVIQDEVVSIARERLEQEGE